MGNAKIPIHYVATIKEAEQLVANADDFWVSNCGCREIKGTCSQSRIDVCLVFGKLLGSSGSGMKKIDRRFAEGILVEAKRAKLVARPFRTDDRQGVDGICFCCQDCCGYFLNPEEICDKGAFIEKTNMEKCTDCAVCVDVCHFNARRKDSDKLIIERSACYGCGLCADVCPEHAVEMGLK